MILLSTHLLKWYMKHGLCVSQVYQVKEIEPSACFASFTDVVSDAGREGDVHPDNAIITDTIT